jgi:hypothetical protein
MAESADNILIGSVHRRWRGRESRERAARIEVEELELAVEGLAGKFTTGKRFRAGWEPALRGENAISQGFATRS